MCGIAGLWSISDIDQDFLRCNAQLMGDSISFRGPDDSGVWIDPFVPLALVHRRLSILDLSKAGHQPMVSSSGRYVISFNGEIYNHLSIRRELETSNLIDKPWSSSCDTETLLCAIEAWGISSTLKRCSGMFAIALWDTSYQRLTLIRDRFGEKPLYWGWHCVDDIRTLLFCSDVAALRSITRTSPYSINKVALTAYFNLGFIPAPLCIYEGFHQLMPGHQIDFDLSRHAHNNFHSTSWWDISSSSLSSQSKLEYIPKDVYLSQLKACLTRSVVMQSSSDVPLGTFLSGGIDSSLITAILQANSSSSISTLTVSFPGNSVGNLEFNEAPYAHDIASYLGTKHTEVSLSSQDALSLIPALPYIYSEPFSDASQIPTHLVCLSARQNGLSVALTGDGGDELFGGYNRHRLAPLIYKYFHFYPQYCKNFISFLINILPIASRGLSRNKQYKLSSAVRSSSSLSSIYDSLLSVFTDSSCLFDSIFLESIITDFSTTDFLSFNPFSTSVSPVESVMAADTIGYLPNDILVKVDRASMYVGLETRAPFLDISVADFMFSSPLHYKIPDLSDRDCTKWALRQILYQFVPPSLIDRPKSGFSTPICYWLRGPLRQWAEDLLSPSRIESQGILNSYYIDQLWRQHLGGRDNSSQLWTVLMWQAWADIWL
ncbi:asparagine synthase (glutamine-hydrolyzing) [Synechococcus sp. UW179A]|uniref:asparagine synthase (glutamine-hydrolyzing) n=1 Tax=Synechococcus sp. UW179A TaxID=2575510 RepID=UPI000E0ED0CE|nr:asparagine synthase (glutamine-hydrolyzing) [Synechococcus sp. UW179A]